MKKLPNTILLLALSIATYYGSAFALALWSIFGNILVWGRWNIFGFIMPFYPFLAGFLIGLLVGYYRKNNLVGILLSVGVPSILALLEGFVFHANFLTLMMSPVPRFEIKFPISLYFPSLIIISLIGYRLTARKLPHLS